MDGGLLLQLKQAATPLGPKRKTRVTFGKLPITSRLVSNGRTLEFLDRYHRLTIIRISADAITYRAKDRLTGRTVVIKAPNYIDYLLMDLKEDFERERRVTARIRHPNIAEVTDLGPDLNAAVSGENSYWKVPFFVMKHLGDETLDTILMDNPGYLPPITAVRIAIQICEGMNAVHKARAVHRDLKPDHIFLVDRDGKRDQVIIIDFGVVLDLDDVQQRRDEIERKLIIGSLPYMAPEQFLQGIIDHRADIYAVGAIFYEMLTGELPLSGSDLIEYKRLHMYTTPDAPSSRRPSLPSIADALVLRALSKDPNERFQSMEEMRESLVQVRAHLISCGLGNP